MCNTFKDSPIARDIIQATYKFIPHYFPIQKHNTRYFLLFPQSKPKAKHTKPVWVKQYPCFDSMP